MMSTSKCSATIIFSSGGRTALPIHQLVAGMPKSNKGKAWTRRTAVLTLPVGNLHLRGEVARSTLDHRDRITLPVWDGSARGSRCTHADEPMPMDSDASLDRRKIREP
jgi:hypothetical protein